MRRVPLVGSIWTSQPDTIRLLKTGGRANRKRLTIPATPENTLAAKMFVLHTIYEL